LGAGGRIGGWWGGGRVEEGEGEGRGGVVMGG
jgi:hypothetical protein